MRPAADTFVETIKEKFGRATLDGKRWITMHSDDNAIQNALLKFGPEALAVVPAIVTYAAARAKNIRDAEADSALSAMLDDIVSTGHGMAALAIHEWMGAKYHEFLDDRVASVSVFPDV
jgi:DNA-directed RNA polymerase subunit K/omega